MATMKEIIDIVSTETGANRKDTQEIITATLKELRRQLETDEKVSVPTLGAFHKRPAPDDNNRYVFKLR